MQVQTILLIRKDTSHDTGLNFMAQPHVVAEEAWTVV